MWETIYNILESENYSGITSFIDELFGIVIICIILFIIYKTISKIKKHKLTKPLFSYILIIILIIVMIWFTFSYVGVFVEEHVLKQRIKKGEYDMVSEGKGEISLPESGRIDHYYLTIKGERLYIDTGLISSQRIPVGEGYYKAYFIYRSDANDDLYPLLVRIDKWIE